MTRRGGALAGALALVLLSLPAARSTTVEQLTAQDLVARAGTIVHGDVTSVRVAWDSTRTRIFTHVEVAPRETIKGQAAARVTLVLPGGELDGVAWVVHGMPRFTPGEEVVLHVTEAHARSGVRVPVGLGQGVRRVARPGGGPAIATRDTRDLNLVRPGAAAGAPGARDEVLLDDLLRDLRAEVARQAAGAPR